MPPPPTYELAGPGKVGGKTLGTASNWSGLRGLTDSGSSPSAKPTSVETRTTPVSPGPRVAGRAECGAARAAGPAAVSPAASTAASRQDQPGPVFMSPLPIGLDESTECLITRQSASLS